MQIAQTIKEFDKRIEQLTEKITRNQKLEEQIGAQITNKTSNF